MAPQASASDRNSSPGGHGAWLEQIALLTGALGAALWQVDRERGAISLAAQWGLGEQRLDIAQQQWQGHSDLLQRTVREGAGQSAEARFELEGETRPLKLQLLPVAGELRDGVLIPQNLAAQASEVRGVLELFVDARHQVSPEGLRGVVQLALLRVASPSGAGAKASASFAPLIAVHNGSTYAETAVLVVHELRRWTGVDRVTLCRRRGSRTVVQAISGLDTFDPRSGAVRALAELVNQSSLDAAPPIPGPAGEQGGASWVWPMNEQEVIVLETFDTAGAATCSAELLAPMMAGCEQALRQSRERDDLRRYPLLRWLSPLWSGGLRRSAVLFVLLTAAVFGLTWVESDLVVTAPGRFTPLQSREVYASLPAVVEEIHVAHGDAVQAGDPLLTLSSDELEFETQKIAGELQTVERQVHDLETLRSESGFGTRATQLPTGAAELAAREEELKVMRQGLTDQLTLLEKQQAQLHVASPLTGTVLTWDVQKLLQGRRIDPTQSLLTVADLSGDWELEVLVPQDDLAAARAAPTESGGVAISVLPPDTQLKLELAASDWATELTIDPLYGAVLPVKALVSAGTLPETLRPGTTVTVQLKCGHAPIGYVWFRHAIDQAVAWWRLRF